MTRPGPKPDPLRKHLRHMFSEWSDRTFATYYGAFRRLSVLVDEGVITKERNREILQSCIRPTGTINVCKYARIAEAESLFWIASLIPEPDDPEQPA